MLGMDSSLGSTLSQTTRKLVEEYVGLEAPLHIATSRTQTYMLGPRVHCQTPGNPHLSSLNVTAKAAPQRAF